jgi:hypothetical protein
MGLVYLIAYLVAVNQFRPLLGEHGLLPVPLFVKQVAFRSAPSLFFLFPTDTAFAIAAWSGVILSAAALLGISERYGVWLSSAIWGLLWALYLSFVSVGQTFYGFGWESMTVEAGFYAIFLGSRRFLPLRAPFWMLRWMLFRVMFGAGLIKMRGDPCWKDLTCLDYHFETQPMPNPLSWYFHWMPAWTHHGGVLFNHFVELIVPFGYFAPQPVATIAGVLTIVFQSTLLISGNLSFLNLLTIVLAIPLLDARWLHRLAPIHPAQLRAPPRPLRYATAGLTVVVVLLSVPPALNMLSPRQIMNSSYNPLQLVNTYGAFGSIGKTRYQVIVEGTAAPVLTPDTQWRAYEFKGQPGDPQRIPPLVAPYHLRLDWLMWFASMSEFRDEPWFVNFMAKLLQGDPAVLSLLRTNPFPAHAPHYVRARLFLYRFTSVEEKRQTGAWWKREFVGLYFPAVSLETPGFRRVLEEQGWL